MRKTTMTLACVVALATGGQVQAGIINGSFEAGFAGWITSDLTQPYFPLSVLPAGPDPTGDPAGDFGFPSVTPTQGSFAAVNGFDGNGPGTIRIAQDVAIPVGINTLTFDYRGGWDLLNFGATQNRLFDVNVEVAGGGANLQSTNILTALAGTSVSDTGALNGSVDLSSFSGQTVRLAFDYFIPENFSGPAQMQLDNVQLHTVPEPSSLAIFAIGGCIAGLGYTGQRKRKVA